MNKFPEIDISNILPFVSKDEINDLQPEINKHYKDLLRKTGKGNDFLGWVNLPSEISYSLIDDIVETANELKSKSKIIVVIGIGGSYLGSKAIIEALSDYSPLFEEKNINPKILFAGQNLCSDYQTSLLKILDKYDYSVIVISKSGTTIEPAIAFRIIRNHITKKYGYESAKKRIIAITDKEKGALKKMSITEGYKTFVIPDNVGGRFSVLTPVGLLPVAAAGINIKSIIEGAKDMQLKLFETCDIDKNIAALYAVCRYLLYNKGKNIEVLACYHPSLFSFIEWWKQLYGESEGKQHKGIFPVGVNYTTDLHSLGQYLQDGMRMIFETVISVERTHYNLVVPADENDIDELSFTAGKDLQQVNKMAMLGTILAHVDGGVPNILISIPYLNEYHLGQLIYMFEFACGLSGYLIDVNPFDQPGVEQYKKNMFALLGKPGYSKEMDILKKRLNIF